MAVPLDSPPAAAVYVKVIVWPVEALSTELVGVVSVPEPSAARTLMLGEEPRFVSDPAEVDSSFACQVAAPAVPVAVAPGPPPLVAP